MKAKIVLPSILVAVVVFKFARMGFLEAYRTAAFVSYGILNFTRSAFLSNAKKFKEEETQVDMSGKNCVVTGANQGIGYATAEAFAARGANVYMVCRNKERGEKAVADIKEKTNNPNVSLEVCDLSSLKQIKDFTSRYTSTDNPLHVLVNNAGILENERLTSVDGLEMNFAVNVAGTYALTELLVSALKKAAPDSRVITVSSGGMYSEGLPKFLQLEDLKKMDGVKQYSRNKRIQVALGEHWTEEYGSQNIGFYTMHPGWVNTEGVKRSIPGFHKMTVNIQRSLDQGVDTIVWLAVAPKNELKSGGFYLDRILRTKHLPGCQTSYSPEQVSSVVSAIRNLSGLSSL